MAEHLASTNVATPLTALKKVSSHFVLTTEKRPALYVFNYQGGGFTIIPADKHLMPVVAYSATGMYTNTDQPGGLLMWEQKTSQFVADARNPATPLPSPSIGREWAAALGSGNAKDTPGGANRPLPDPPPVENTETIVGPLLPVTWGQGCTYNDLCRAGNSCGGHRYTGCVMTAMAQVMAYWRYPSTYNWSAMPVNYGNTDVQQLMLNAQQSIPSLDDSKDEGTGAHLSDVAGMGVFGHTISPAAGF